MGHHEPPMDKVTFKMSNPLGRPVQQAVFVGSDHVINRGGIHKGRGEVFKIAKFFFT